MNFSSLHSQLVSLSNEFSVKALKAEFEAEGSNLEDLCLISELCNTTNISLTIKVGGVSALRDFYETWQIGASFILVPMIESSYTLKFAVDNYLKCLNLFPEISRPPKFLFNLESICAFNNLSSICDFVAGPFGRYISGVVIGRSDFCNSLEFESVEDKRLLDMSSSIVNAFKQFPDFHITVGGSVTTSSYDNLAYLSSLGVTAFETRKCTLSTSNLSSRSNFSSAVTQALRFEKSWHEFKLNRQDSLSRSDAMRIKSINSRLI